MVGASGVIVIADNVAAVTVIELEPDWPAIVAVMVAAPGASPVTKP